MLHRNASISNETISREQTIAKLRKRARICKWATPALPQRSLWDSSQSLRLTFCSYCLAFPRVVSPIRRTSSRRGAMPCYRRYRCAGPTMLVAHDGHTAIGSLLMTCLALTIAISVRRLFFNIEKEGRPFDLECNQTLRRVGHLFLIGGVAVRLLGAVITGMILSGFGGSFTDAFVGQLFEPSMLFAGLIICLDCQHLPLRVYPAKAR